MNFNLIPKCRRSQSWILHSDCNKIFWTGTPPPFSYIFIMVKKTFKVFLFCYIQGKAWCLAAMIKLISAHAAYMRSVHADFFLFWKYFRLLSCSMAFRLLPGTETSEKSLFQGGTLKLWGETLQCIIIINLAQLLKHSINDWSRESGYPIPQ